MIRSLKPNSDIKRIDRQLIKLEPSHKEEIWLVRNSRNEISLEDRVRPLCKWRDARVANSMYGQPSGNIIEKERQAEQSHTETADCCEDPCFLLGRSVG